MMTGKLARASRADVHSLAGRFAHDHSLSSHFGHDKSLEIKPYAALPDSERPVLLYAGDGVSDLSAAAETNLLFAKEGKGNCPLFKE